MQKIRKFTVVLALCLSVLLLPACGRQFISPVLKTSADETPSPEAAEATPEPTEAVETPEPAEVPEEPEETPEETPDAEAWESEGTLGSTPDDIIPVDHGPAVITVLSPEASGTLMKETGQAIIDYSHTEDGYVMARWTGDDGARVKVLVKGPSGTTYQYNLDLYGSYETFPLSDGSGGYNVGIYRNVGGSQYSTVMTLDVSVALRDEFAPFLRPNQYVNYTMGSSAVEKAAELCAGITDNLEKTAVVYDYVVNNVSYDMEKAQTVTSGYLPDIDDTYLTGKGICFDYAALMAGMLRSQEVPVKLVIGYTGSAYHAWLSVYSQTDGWMNAQIYFDGHTWKLMDPTFASNGGQSEDIMQYIGNGANYQAKYLY